MSEQLDQSIPDSDADDRKVRRVATATAVLIFIAWTIDYADRLIITVALPFIGKDLSLNKTEQGAIVSSFFIAYALFQVPGGLLADRFGAKRVMASVLALWSIFTAWTGLVTRYAELLIVRFVFGTWEGMFPGASWKAITERTRSEHRLTVNGFVYAGFQVGAALAPLIAAPIILVMGWRQVFWIVAGAGVIFAVVLWLALPKPLPPTKQVLTGRVAAEDAVAPAGKKSGDWRAMLQVLRSPTMWTFSVVFFGADVVGWGVKTWVPSYLYTEEGVNIIQTGILVAIPSLAAAFGVLIGGWLFDRHIHHRHREVIITCSLLNAVFLVFMVLSRDPILFTVFLTLGTFIGGGGIAFLVIFGLPLRMLPGAVTGSGSAMVNFGGQVAGVLIPVIMGFLADVFSFKVAFAALIVACVGSAVAAWRTPPNSEEFAKRLRRQGILREPKPAESASHG